MNLAEAEKSCRREREDEPSEHGRGRAQADPAPQHVRPEPAQDTGKQRHDVDGEHGISGQPQHRRGEERTADEILGIGECVGVGVEDVRVEDRQRLGHQRVRVPGQYPHDEHVVVTGPDQMSTRGDR